MKKVKYILILALAFSMLFAGNVLADPDESLLEVTNAEMDDTDKIFFDILANCIIFDDATDTNESYTHPVLVIDKEKLRGQCIKN